MKIRNFCLICGEEYKRLFLLCGRKRLVPVKTYREGPKTTVLCLRCIVNIKRYCSCIDGS